MDQFEIECGTQVPKVPPEVSQRRCKELEEVHIDFLAVATLYWCRTWVQTCEGIPDILLL